MRVSQALRPLRCHYFIPCVAVMAVIIFMRPSGLAQAAPAPSAISPQDLKQYSGLLTEFGQIMKKIQDGVQFPAPRTQSRLLPLLPESTVFYAAFPNYGEASHQALAIFQQEAKDNPELRSRWEHLQSDANSPKIEDSLEKLYQLSQYLGDEIVVSEATTEDRDHPSFLMLAEVRKPGLKDFLRQRAKEIGGNLPTSVRIFEPQDLATAKDKGGADQVVILVRPDFVVVALGVGQLCDFNARLERKSQEFASSPFGQRLLQGYEDGTTVVAGLNVQSILQQVASKIPNQKAFERSGFADAKYLMWEHKSVAGQATSQMELSFTGPRQGVASWLAAPGPLNSLDFISPKALMAGGVLLKNPAQMFDEVADLANLSNPNALAALAPMEQGLKISLKDDVFGNLAGEIAFEFDGLAQSVPAWKLIFKVNDPERLQKTLDTLLTAAKMTAQQSEEDGVTYHTFPIPGQPSAKKTAEIAYASVDGYLIVGSGRETVAEAIHLHRSGESLAKSSKFQESLPPGNLSEVSGLLYEDPVAVAGLSMRQASPEVAEMFSHWTGESTPVVIAGYGDESAIRESSRSSGVDAGAVLVIAAIAIPNLLRARIAANESSAVASVRTANTAQITYAAGYPQRGFARDLAALGPDPVHANAISSEHASLIDSTLANASCTAGAWCTKSGYRFSITAICKKQRCDEYVVIATPVSTGSGTRSFCSTSDAVIRYQMAPPLTSPISLAECLQWSPLQ